MQARKTRPLGILDGLPPELRHMIYQEHFDACFKSLRNHRSFRTLASAAYNTMLALLSTSKTMHNDSLLIYRKLRWSHVNLDFYTLSGHSRLTLVDSSSIEVSPLNVISRSAVAPWHSLPRVRSEDLECIRHLTVNLDTWFGRFTERLRSLKDLKFDHSRTKIDGVELLTGLSGLRSLRLHVEVIDLFDEGLDDRNARILDALAIPLITLPSLLHLEVAWNPIDLYDTSVIQQSALQYVLAMPQKRYDHSSLQVWKPSGSMVSAEHGTHITQHFQKHTDQDTSAVDLASGANM